MDIKTLDWFRSYLSDRTQKCQVNGQLSSSKNLSCGIPQGTILGPLLFLIYINDLPKCLDHGASPRMYADDTNINVAASNYDELQNLMNNALENINLWLRANKLSLNVTKTELMIIGSRQRLASQAHQGIHVHIGDKQIKRVTSTKTLGVIVGEHLSWRNHIDKLTKKSLLALVLSKE